MKCIFFGVKYCFIIVQDDKVPNVFNDIFQGAVFVNVFHV